MPTFTVTCADRETGAEYPVRLAAASADEALGMAANLGHLASSAAPAEFIPGLAAPNPIDADDPAERARRAERLLCEIRNTASATYDLLARCALVHSPRSTIGWGVVAGVVLLWLIPMVIMLVLVWAGILVVALKR